MRIIVAACMLSLIVATGCETKKDPQTEQEKELRREQKEIDGLVE